MINKEQGMPLQYKPIKAKLVINDTEYPLGGNSIADIIEIVWNGYHTCDFFTPIIPSVFVDELALSEYPELRNKVARSQYITKSAVQILLKDKQIDVLRALSRSCYAWEHLEFEDIIRLVETNDLQILRNISNSIGNLLVKVEGDYSATTLIDKLSSVRDFEVQKSILEYIGRFEHTMKKISEDADPDIQRCAAQFKKDRNL